MNENTTRIEQMRKAHMKSGICSLCYKYTEHLERHHIRYNPEILIYVCHNCHHAIHFYPQRLPLRARLTIANKIPGLTEEQKLQYAENMKPAGKINML